MKINSSTENWLKPLAFMEPVLENCPDYTFIAGGALLSAYTNEPINDIDLWSNNPKLVIDYLKELDGCKLIAENDMFCDFEYKEHKLQVIKMYEFDSMEDCVWIFDFTCISAAWDGRSLCTHPEFFTDATTRRVRLKYVSKPISTLKRMIRYSTEKKFTVADTEYSKLFKFISQMDVEWDKISITNIASNNYQDD